MSTATLRPGDAAWLTVLLAGKRFVYQVTVVGRRRDTYRVRLEDPVARLETGVLREGEYGLFPSAALAWRGSSRGR